MSQVLIFILGALFGALVTYFFSWTLKMSSYGSFGASARREKTKEENKKKLLDFLSDKDRVSNDDIQDLLNVSDASAERYLDELEKEGKLKQVGNIGQAVFYEVIR